VIAVCSESQSVYSLVYVYVCVCVYFPHNDQLGRTDFPHNALSPQCIVRTYRCVCVCVRVTQNAGWNLTYLPVNVETPVPRYTLLSCCVC